MEQFAVVDVETTGIFPGGHDRVIEIAVVTVAGDGRLLDEYSTLVNPERDVGSTRIHGITARDASAAPVFSEVAGDLVDRLRERTVVAHNARFDTEFLHAEYARLGQPLPAFPAICTLRLVRRIATLPRYRLEDCCQRLGVELSKAHAALADARATAGVFIQCMRQHPLDEDDRQLVGSPPDTVGGWPDITPTGKAYRREHASLARSTPSYLARLASRLPRTAELARSECLEYADLLDRALEDRVLTTAESEALYETALRWGLTTTQAHALHQRYWEGLVEVAAADGVITDGEREDLVCVAQLLGSDQESVTRMLDAATCQATDRVPAGGPEGEETLRGNTVCFTGESRCQIEGAPMTRATAERLATEAGLIVRRSATKELNILVLADPESQSTKARKARVKGTRLMAERVFWRKLGVDVT